MQVLNNIVDIGDRDEDGKNSRVWNLTAPRGAEAVQVLQVVNDLADLLVKSLVKHVKWNDIQLGSDSELKLFQVNLGEQIFYFIHVVIIM